MRALGEQLAAAGNISELKLRGLRRDRRPVLPGGLVILWTLFEELGLESLRASASALREGLLLELREELRRT